MFTPFNAQVPCIVVEPGHGVRLLTDQRSEPTCAPCSAIAQFFFLPAPPANATPPTRYSPTSPPKSPSHPARNEDHDNHAGPHNQQMRTMTNVTIMAIPSEVQTYLDDVNARVRKISAALHEALTELGCNS